MLAVPMPVTAATREVLQSHFGVATLKPDPEAYVQKDFAALLETLALFAGVKLESENVAMSDGLEPEAAAPALRDFQQTAAVRRRSKETT